MWHIICHRWHENEVNINLRAPLNACVADSLLPVEGEDSNFPAHGWGLNLVTLPLWWRWWFLFVPSSVVRCQLGVCVFFLVLSSVAVLLADILSVYVVLLSHYLLLIVIMLSSFVQIGTFALLLLSHLTHKHNPGLVRPRPSSLGAVSWGQLLVFCFGPLTGVHKKERNVSDWAFRVRYWFVRIIGLKRNSTEHH